MNFAAAGSIRSDCVPPSLSRCVIMVTATRFGAGWYRSLLRHEDSHLHVPVGTPGIAATVLARARLMIAFQNEDVCQPTSLLEIAHELVALSIHVRGDVVRDLAGCVTEADALVVGRRPCP